MVVINRRMSMPLGKLWARPDHTIGKHDLLVAYLNAWVPILGQQFGRAMVVDGFAGPGEYEGGELGSPLLSWRVAGGCKASGRLGSADLDFRFFDSDPDRVEHLRGLMRCEDRFTGMYYRVEEGLCADLLSSILFECRYEKIPLFVMLDPFGLKGVSLDLISDILAVGHSEVLFSFMHGTAVRLGETVEIHEHLMGLVGDEEPLERSADGYCDVFERRFRSAGAGYVLRFGLWHGRRHVYTLFFGTNSLVGCERMKDAMWKVAGDGAYRFDGVRLRQPVLLSESSFDPDDLHRDLVMKFGYGVWKSVDDLDVFMQGDGTMFRKGHLRGVLKDLQARRCLQVQGQGRRGTFPGKKGVKVLFVGSGQWND